MALLLHPALAELGESKDQGWFVAGGAGLA
jgi:hypothetical protein